MKKIINLKSLKELARPHLTKMAFDFIAGGAEDEWTLRHNRLAWDDFQILPRVLSGSPDRDLTTTVLGERIDFPILMAPMGFQCLANPEGEVAGALGASEAGTIFCLSTTSTRSIEDVAEGSDGPKWFQLYVYKDRGITRDLVRRAVASGYKAICLTVDNQIEGRRERDKYNEFHMPPGMTLANFKKNPELTKTKSVQSESALTKYIEGLWDEGLSWKDVDWVASLSPLPLIIKGLLSPADAELAIEHGARAVIVSNHGGRQLDGVLPTAHALSDIVDAVQGRAEVYVDGGIRRGTHVLKALALGARAVLVGRPAFWGLALGGADGVRDVFLHLKDELDIAMELSGCQRIAEISPNKLASHDRKNIFSNISQGGIHEKNEIHLRQPHRPSHGRRRASSNSGTGASKHKH